MTLNRIFIGLVQPLLALLLMAGMAQAEPCLFDDDNHARVIERSLGVSITLSDQTGNAFQTVQAPPASDQDDYGDGLHALSPAFEFILDQARLIRNARVSHPTAPPSHWPRAAFSTGPPLV